VYDTTTQQRISYIDRPKNSPRADLYKCRLCWKDDATLLIGWANSVKIGVVKDKQRFVQNTHTLTLTLTHTHSHTHTQGGAAVVAGEQFADKVH
jgi:hypothetical protein